MALTTTYISLAVWDLATDGYSHDELANNWLRVDGHNHAGDGGAPLPPEAIPPLGSGQIGAGSVGTAQLADHAVTNIKIATGAVGSRTIANGAVTLGKIAAGAVDTTALADDAVTGPKLSDSSAPGGAAVQSGHINDSAVATRHIADNSVSSPKLTSNAVHTGNIQDGAVTGPKLANGAVDTAELANGAVDSDKLARGAVAAENIGSLPAVYVKTNKARDISNGEDHVVFDNFAYDTDNMWHQGAPAFVTVQTTGIYAVSAGVYWQDHDTDNQPSGHRRMYIRRNGGQALAGDGPASTNTDYRNFDNNGNPVGPVVHSLYQNASTIVFLQEGDAIDVAIFSGQGGGSQYMPNDDATHLSLVWVAPFTGFIQQ